ncbi:glycosyltransferase family 9 protein [Leptolyngbya sp. FACHB-321]|uniref:glycosyltransferase family 9 protein n=1 Tax=Leptolyngbya sp. FACHB-321 TaxID=2692807 RepID=UPI0016822373|nr:glycosyltransferase family 9 protein [Leptolyngbya sp. FACHB-321]MBD2034641.1 glycosyltransferase family 9 protein [Leptolyngbya sp. FACHB-321]
MKPDVQSILFIELLGGIGDVSIALPAIQALGRAYPQAKLTVLTFASGGELIQSDPLIHEVVCLKPQPDAPHLARSAIEAVLRRQSFDLIVSDTNYDGIDTLLQQSSAPRVVTNLWRSPPPNQKVGDRFLQILQAEGLITPADSAPAQLHLLPAEQCHVQQQLGAIAQPLVVLYPDAGMAIKRWSTANFVRVGQALQQQYNATIVVPIGSDPESAQIVEAIGGTAKVWAPGTLRSLAALMATAALVIAADTGPARIAAALQTPTITLFGPSWHERYGQPAPHINLQGYPDCPERQINNFTTQRCWYSGECPFDRWHTCLEDISPAEVLAAAAPFLQPLASSVKRPTSELGHSSLELGVSSLELGTSSLELNSSTSNL